MRNKLGKPFGPPPKRGPNPQVPPVKLKKGGFDPEGSGYDYKNAPEPSYKELGYFPKYGSLDPKTGMVLKGRKHPTYKKTEEAEKKLGNKIIKKGKRYYSVKKKKEGGLNRDERFMGFLSKQFNQNKDRIIKEVVLPGLIRKDFGARVKNLMNQAVRDFDAQEGEAPYTMNFVAYNPKKEETGITTKETMGLKKGKMVGCPHRERGARSDIKGISKIQVKGKKFTGVF